MPPPKRRVFVGKCVECGVSLYYNEDQEKLVVGKGGDPDCLHHYDWPEKEGEANGETED